MVIGFLLIGACFGLIAGIASLILGSGILMALLVYSGVGATGVVLAALLTCLPKGFALPVHS